MRFSPVSMPLTPVQNASRESVQTRHSQRSRRIMRCGSPCNIALDSLHGSGLRLSPSCGVSFAPLWLHPKFRRAPSRPTVLGVAEAGFFPGAVFYLNRWYKRSEQRCRVSLAATGTLSGAFGGLFVTYVGDSRLGKTSVRNGF